MTVAASCLNHDSLKNLLEHAADPAEIERLAAHLETCARCGETVDSLLATDRTAAALRGAKIAADEPSVQLLRARLAKLRPGLTSQETTGGENTRSAAAPPSLEPAKDKNASLKPPQQPDEIGRLGGYRILKELGRGGMGVVYKAEDLKLKRLVALKVMAPSLAADAPSRQRFLREAVAMAAVHHDNIVTIHTVDEDNGVPFLAMEFLQGMPMDKWLKGGRKVTPAQVLKLGREIAEGLAAAHERGLIHRDIKPGNIWLDSAHKGRVKILDFGLARSGTEDVHLTQSGAIVGTPAYMSPEQARSEKVDGRSDLFSLGCVLYRLCAGAMPFAGDTMMSLLMALAMDHPKPVRDLNPDVPVGLSDLVTRLLAKKPEERPQSAREVVQEIQAISRALAGSSFVDGRAGGIISAVGTKPVGIKPAARSATYAVLPAPSSDGKKRRPWIVAAVAAGFLATAMLVAIVIIIRDKDGKKTGELKLPPGSRAEIRDEEKKGEAAVAPKPTVDDAWIKEVAAMPLEKQVEAVAAKLKELNPGFDGKESHNIDGAVTQLNFAVDNVTDISPLRALTGLRELGLNGSIERVRFSDLSPLRNLKLTVLDCNGTRVSDLSPLKDMKLTHLGCGYTQVSDLSPLKDMKLASLCCWHTAVFDLSPLKGMKQTLTSLECNGTRISDLTPLTGMKLTCLKCLGTSASDLSPLKGMPLRKLDCEFKPERDAAILRSIKTLELLNGKPAAEVWKEVDAAAKPVDDALVKQVAAMPPEKQMEAVVAKLKALNPGFDGKETHNIDGAVTQLNFAVDNVTDISPLRALTDLRELACCGRGDGAQFSDLSPLKGMKLTSLECHNTQVSDLSPLKDVPLTSLNCESTQVTDLTPLKGMLLRHLNCGSTKVTDLSPLKGMPLTTLVCDQTPVSDLSPLMGMKLTHLNCGDTRVLDLTPLKGMPLTVLSCIYSRVSDLSPIKGMPLKDLSCDFNPERDAAVLRSIKTLETINGKPAAEFWKDVGIAAEPPVDDAWVKQIATLPAEKQVEAVVAELKARNPGFNGKATPTIEDGKVTGLQFLTDDVTDVSPVRSLTNLRKLFCFGATETVRFSDLSPLRDLKLTVLDCNGTRVSDLSPLKNMKLTHLGCGYTQVSDLSPLKDMKLASLCCWHTAVFDLSPLKDMPLTGLAFDGTRVSDLSPLKGMKLTHLSCPGTPVSDLSPLRRMPLTSLICDGAPVTDLSPLKGMPLISLGCSRIKASDLSPLKELPLKNLYCDFDAKRDADILRSIKTLETINDKPAAEFWKDVDAKKP